MIPLSVKINTMALVCIPPVEVVFLMPSNVTWTLEQTPDFIFTGMSLQTFQCNTEENVTDLGSKLFTRLVSGTRCSIRPLSKQTACGNYFYNFFKSITRIFNNYIMIFQANEVKGRILVNSDFLSVQIFIAKPHLSYAVAMEDNFHKYCLCPKNIV